MTTGTLPLGFMSEHDERPVPGAGEPAVTGNARVDQSLARLAELAGSPVHEHAGIVEDIHQALQDSLAEDED